jgi:hypothetical protein
MSKVFNMKQDREGNGSTIRDRKRERERERWGGGSSKQKEKRSTEAYHISWTYVEGEKQSGSEPLAPFEGLRPGVAEV